MKLRSFKQNRKFQSTGASVTIIKEPSDDPGVEDGLVRWRDCDLFWPVILVCLFVVVVVGGRIIVG